MKQERCRLAGRTALVTGGSRGIGRAIAVTLAAEGADVAFSYASEHASAEATLKEIRSFGVKGAKFACDFRDVSDVFRLASEAIGAFGVPDILVNNVGVLTRTSFADITVEQFDWVLSVNLKAPFFLSQSLAKAMIADKRPGTIINISSLSADRARSAVAHYQCSKAGLNMMTRSLAYELAPHGIRVNAVSPGLTATEGNRNQWEHEPALWRERAKGIPLERTGVPQDHAGAVVFLASDESSWMTGANLIVDGGMAIV